MTKLLLFAFFYVWSIISIACWLWQRIRAHSESIGNPRAPANNCPDFLDPDELGEEGGDWSEWAEYVASHPTTIHHLNRCLNQ
jgi:hypothetical protein